MDSEMIAFLAKSGIFAVLFVLLLYYILIDGRQREKEYRDLIDVLTDRLIVVEDIKSDVKDIKKNCQTKVNIKEELC